MGSRESARVTATTPSTARRETGSVLAVSLVGVGVEWDNKTLSSGQYVKSVRYIKDITRASESKGGSLCELRTNPGRRLDG